MKKILKHLLACIAITLLAACSDDFFEFKSEINPPVTTVADMERAVAGAYYAMTGNQGNESNFDVLAVVAASISDESRFITEAGNNTDVANFYNYNNASDIGIANSAFFSSYKSIASCNQWLAILEAGDLEGLPDDQQLPRMQGELYFLRAYNYYILAKLFAPPYGDNNSQPYLPLRLTVPTGINDANAPAATVEEVYQSIVDDLVQSTTLLPETGEGQYPSYSAGGRTNRAAAHALLARVYFQMGRWDEALSSCNAAIASASFDLSEAPLVAWSKNWEGGAKDVLWSFAVGNTAQRNGLGGSTSNWKLPRRYSFFNYSILSSNESSPGAPPGGNMRTLDRTLAISDALLKSAGWLNEDRTPSAKALSDLRYSTLVQYNAGTDPVFPGVAPQQYWINKYWRGPQSDWRAGAIPLIRLSEVYLTRAKILFSKGDAQGAADDLNAVRRRAWDATAAGSEYVDLLAGDVSNEVIDTERMIELMFEGDRPYYLQALKAPIPRADRGDGTTPYNDAGLYYLLPVSERELNQGLGD
jgi:starch-binding outer membrane protein, SusD/RagB family